MTDIRIDVELRHPARRVWLALTEPRLLSQWFAETEPAIRAGGRFRMRPVDLPVLGGPLIGEALEVDEHRRLVMRWGGGDRRTVVACDLASTATGCRLTFLEFPEAGTWQPKERDDRESAYQRALTGRLPAVLDWLAFQEVELTPVQERSAPNPDATGPDATGAPRRRTAPVRLAAAGGAVVLVVAVGTTLVLIDRDSDGYSAAPPAPSPTAAVSATAPATTPPERPRPQAAPPSATPTRTATTGRPTATARTTTADPGRPRVEARYRTLSSRLFGYTGEVRLDNSGDAASRDWTVTVTVAAGSTVTTAAGADYRQDGRQVTFTGPPVDADDSIRFEFEVIGDRRIGPKRPDGCTIGESSCAGL